MSTEGQESSRRLAGLILMTVGWLIAGLCGLCTGLFALGGLFFIDDGGIGLTAMAFIIGGLPTLIGIGLILWGRALRKPRPQDQARVF